MKKLSRRDSLLQCAALGALRLAPWLGLNQAVSALEAQEQNAARKPTQWNEIGPFYKRRAPKQTQLRNANDPGLPLTVSGTVFGARGEALPGAEIEIWQADHKGVYDLDGYRFRAALLAGRAGEYSFDGNAGALRGADVSAHPLPGNSAGAQASDYATVLRHRSSIEGEPGCQLFARSAADGPGLDKTSDAYGRSGGDSGERYIRSCSGAAVMRPIVVGVLLTGSLGRSPWKSRNFRPRPW